VQPARVWHLLGIARVQQLAFGANDAYDVFTLLNLLTTLGTVSLRATAPNGADIGFVCAELDDRRRLGWVVTLGVIPQWHRRGIGSALLNAAEAAMITRVPRMHLTVRGSNVSARRLYEQHGYRHVQSLTRYYRDGEEGLVMEKQLS
jgi:ribosomal protein S18 acetylase RimI-like enzyme